MGRSSMLFVAPTVVRGVVGFAMIPAITYVLTQHDVGVVGLILPVAALGAALATSFTSYLIAAHYQVLDEPDRRGFMCTLLAASLGVCVLTAIVVRLLAPQLEAWVPGFGAAPAGALDLTLIGMVLSLPWMIASEIITLEGRAIIHAWTAIGQTVIGAAVTLTGLYLLELGVMAVFVANLAGALTTLVGAWWMLRRFLWAPPRRRWLGEIRKLGLLPFAGTLAAVVQINLERSLLSNRVGLNQLGLYNHSLNYNSLLAELVKALTRTLWPRTLIEARDGNSVFPTTGAIWGGMYIGLACVGVGAALLGKPMLALLTHDRFTGAYVLLPFWVIVAILQNMGRTHNAILLAAGQGRRHSQLALLSNLAWLLAILALLPWLGMLAGALALAAQFAAMRLGFWYFARRIQPSAGPDRIGLACIGVILLVVAVAEWSQPGLAVRMVACAGCVTLLLAVSWRRVHAMATHFGFATVATR